MNKEQAFKGATSRTPELWLNITAFFAGMFVMWFLFTLVHRCPKCTTEAARLDICRESVNVLIGIAKKQQTLLYEAADRLEDLGE